MELWTEGYKLTGNESKAIFHGNFECNTLREAVILFKKSLGDSQSCKYINTTTFLKGEVNMWYENENDLDYSKPIVAEDSYNNRSLLVPQIQTGDYKIIGYNWLNLETGKYSSCHTFKNIDESIGARKTYDLYNIDI